MKKHTKRDIWRKNLVTQGTKLISPIQTHTNQKQCNDFRQPYILTLMLGTP